MWCWILCNTVTVCRTNKFHHKIPQCKQLQWNPRQAPRLWRLTCQPHTRRRGLIWWGQQAMQILEGSSLRIMFAHDVEISWKIFWLQHPHLFLSTVRSKSQTPCERIPAPVVRLTWAWRLTVNHQGGPSKITRCSRWRFPDTMQHTEVPNVLPHFKKFESHWKASA